MKYKDVKRRLKEGKEFSFKEIKEWIKYVSKSNSVKDFFNGKHISRQLLFKNFENIVSSLSDEELVILKDYLVDIPILLHKDNQILLNKLKEQTNNEQIINVSLLRACLNLAYGKDKEGESIEDVNNTKQYFEKNFGKIINKNLYSNFSDAYGVFLAYALRERQEYRDIILQTLRKNVKLYGKDLYTKDFRWFTNFLHEFDSNYLIEHSTEFIDILPSTEINFYIDLLRKNPNIEKSSKILRENATSFLQQSPTPLITLKKIKELNNSFEEKDSMDIEKLQEIISARDVVEEITQGRVNEKVKETLVMLITDIADSEDCKISNMEEIGNGGFLTTYKLGNKVIKIGEKPYQYRIPKNHRRFLQPIVRTEQIFQRIFSF